MKLQLFALLLAMVAFALAQGVTDQIAPPGGNPDGCTATTNGEFEIAVVPLAFKAKRDFFALESRAACANDGNLQVRLANGVLTDDQNRTGYIASNFQFQFDNPPQAGALYTAGFSQCTNGSLALGSTTVFWQCASGTFFNLYDRWWAYQCAPVHILVMPCQGTQSAVDAGETVVATETVTTTVVVPLDDGQPQVVTTTSLIYICQIGDGQIQGHTTPCTGAAPTPVVSLPPVSQIPDGQIQVTPGVSAAGVPGAQETATTTSGPAVVPTDAPFVGGAAGGSLGRVGAGALMVGLGVAAVGWF